MWTFASIALAAAATGCLFWSWRQSVHRPALNALGWAGLLASLACFSRALGPEFGIALGLASITLWAWLYSLANIQQDPKRAAKAQPTSPLRASAKGIAVQLGLGLLFIFIYGVASAFITIYGVYALEISEADQMAMVLVLMPILWAGLIVCSLFFIYKRAV